MATKEFTTRIRGMNKIDLLLSTRFTII